MTGTDLFDGVQDALHVRCMDWRNELDMVQSATIPCTDATVEHPGGLPILDPRETFDVVLGSDVLYEVSNNFH